MKKFKLLALLCAAPLLLAGCDSNQQGGSGAEPAGSGSSQQSSQSYLGPTSDENIMKDICNALFGSAVKGTDYDDGSYYGFGSLAFYEGYTSDAQVEEATRDVMADLPSYLSIDPEYPFESGTDTDDYGTFFYASVSYLTADSAYSVDLFSYVESVEEGGPEGTSVYIDVYSVADAEAFYEQFADLLD